MHTIILRKTGNAFLYGHLGRWAYSLVAHVTNAKRGTKLCLNCIKLFIVLDV